MTFRAPNPHKSSKKYYINQKPCETTQNHRKTSNVTEIKHESHKKSQKKQNHQKPKRNI
jgi:hypothetical protein